MIIKKRWLSYQEVRDQLDITGVELLAMIKQGLPVYDQHGQPVDFDDFCLSQPVDPDFYLPVKATPEYKEKLSGAWLGESEAVKKAVQKWMRPFDEVRIRCIDKLIFFGPDLDSLAPGREPPQAPPERHRDVGPDGITLEDVKAYPREKIPALYAGQHMERQQIRTANRALDALTLYLQGMQQADIYKQLAPDGQSEGPDAARSARSWINHGRRLVLTSSK